MAIEGQEKTQTIKPQTRTRIIEIVIPYGKVPSLRAHREVVNRDPDGKVLSKDNAPEVSRGYVEVIDEVFVCADGTEVSIPHISEALSGLIDQWSVEDAETRAAAAAAAAEEVTETP